MKYIRKLHSYLRGIRLSLVFLALMMLVALITAILVFAKVQYLRTNYDVVASAGDQLEQVYFFGPMISSRNWESGSIQQFGKELREPLSNFSAIDHVYFFDSFSPQSYGDQISVSIQLYDPELLELFPKLRDMGIDFTDPKGCILSHPDLREVKVGSTISLHFYDAENSIREFPVIGRLNYPYYSMGLQASGTNPTIDYFFSQSTSILMLATEENLAELSTVSRRFYGTNFLIRFREDASPEERLAVETYLSQYGPLYSVVEMLEEGKKALREAYIQLLPMPMFLLVISTFSFLSTLILTFKKKERELSIYYLCGASRAQCMALILGAFSLTALIPTVIAVVFSILAPSLNWQYLLLIEEYLIDARAVWLVVIYFLVSLGVAVGTTWMQMRRHTPLTFLRGAER